MLRPIFRPPIQLLARRGRAVTSWPSSSPSSSRVAAVLLRRDVRRPYASEAVEVALGSLPIEKSAAPDPESQTDPAAPAEDFGGDDEVAPTTTLPPVQGQFYISSVFPIQLGKVDPRPLIASFRKNDLLEQFPSIASHVHIHSFKYLRTEKQVKDGGVFVTFSFVPPEEGEGPREKALQEIQEALFKAAEGQGGLKTWSYSGSAKIWRVLGRPWHEDMNKFPSSQVKVAFDGPDVHQEVLYDLLRPYGRIASLTPPTPQPPLTPRFALLQFTRLHSSTAAVAALHGLSVSPVPPEVITVHSASEAKAEPKPAPTPTLTRLSLSYQSPLQKHFFRDWISNHPKISLPALFFIIGTLSYTFFDPIRDFFITSKVLGRFNVEGYPIIKHVKALAATLLPHVFGDINSPSKPSQSALDPLKPSETETAAWREREEAEKLAEGWLRDYPSGFVLVSGPHGSGKNALVAKIVEQESKKALVIDCARIAKAKTEAGMVTELASQTGYWPFFGFLTSLNSLIDLAAMGLIGQKAGFSTDFPTQLKQILDIVSTSLKHVAEHELTGQARHAKSATDEALREAENLAFAERLKRVGYHDPRLDSIAGNGIMSELGYGDEIMTANDLAQPTDEVYLDAEQPSSEPGVLSGVTADVTPASDSVYLDEERDAISALPVVVLRDFALKGSKKDELWSTIAEWAAGLIENRIAQVVVVCDNSSASKPLARALPSKPLNSIALADADSKAALSFVAEKLGDSHPEMTEKDKSLVSIFGGRMNDLEGLIFKVRTGQTIADAVDDILTRTQIELRKSVFGDDAEEAKNLPWTRPQAWKIVSSLAKRGEVSYSALLLGFPFKGNEDKLKALEAAEFISVTYVNGRPSVVKAGKPLYLATFKKLVEDPVFHASQTLASDAEVISSAEATIKACETELLSLKEVGFESGKGWPVISGSGPIEIRARYLMDKMKAAQISINSLETEAAEFKTVLTTST